MRRDIRSSIPSAQHHSPNLLSSELQMINLVRRTTDAPGPHDLDEITPRPDLLPYSLHALRHAIAHPSKPRRRPATTSRVIVLASEIRMPARLRQRVPSDEQPRAGENAVLDAFFDCGVGAAAVPHAGEAAVQHLRADVRLAQQADGLRVAEGLGELGEAWDGDQVHVAVD